MKKYLLVLSISCLGFAAMAQETPYLTKSLASSGIKEVYVETSGGSISVSGAASDPRIEVYIKGNNGLGLSKEEIEKRLNEDYELDISASNHELHARAKRKHDGDGWDWKRQLSISFKVFVPREVNTHLGTSGGSIHLDNLTGSENFSTSGGSLHMDALNGMIKGETSGGSISVSNSGENITLETSGGSIHADHCQGKMHMETSGGSLHLDNLKGEINAQTSGGSVEASDVDGELVTGTSGGSVNVTHMAGSLEASTSGGSMNIELIRLGKYVKLDDSGGHINLTLPGKQGLDLNLNADRISSQSLSNFSGEWDKTHVKGTLNGGGVPVTVDASGHLSISFN